MLKIAGTDMFEDFMHEYYNIGSGQNKIKPYDQCCIQGTRYTKTESDVQVYTLTFFFYYAFSGYYFLLPTVSGYQLLPHC